MEHLYFNGFTVGFLYTFTQFAAILLCIRHVLRDGWWSGISLGAGNAVSQIMFVLLAYFLAHYPSEIMMLNKIFIIFTAATLFLMTYHFYKHPSATSKLFSTKNILLSFLIGIIVTVPFIVDITGYLGILRGMGIRFVMLTRQELNLLTATVVLGNVCWWLIFTGILTIFHKNTTTKRLQILNKISVIIMFCLGVLTLLTLLV